MLAQKGIVIKLLLHIPSSPIMLTGPSRSENQNRTFFPLYANVSLRTLILSIMTNSPIVTMISKAKPNQPRTMAVVPTPLLTLPFPKSWAMMDAATEAVCCHSTDTRTNIEAMKMIARAIWETGREGKGLTSRSLPCASSSSCHPGKVASKRRQMNAKMMAMMLEDS